MLLHQIIERGAANHPDKPALIFRDQPISYAQLWGIVREIIRFARERLANFKVPREVIFLRELPLSNMGKVLKRLLKKELELEA